MLKNHLLGCVILLIGLVPVVDGQTLDVLITNARIVDGTGNPWFNGSIGIAEGKIACVGKCRNDAKLIIDADQQIVSPGFIDVHGHIESSIRSRPEARNFVQGGVTSIITGNCGGSSLHLEEFFHELRDSGISINVASLIGHNTVRRAVMGASDRMPTASELDSMQRLVDRGMRDGAVGLSTGLIYVPGTYATTEEVVTLAKVAAQYGGVYASHIRNESDKVLDAITEAVEVGKQAQMPVEISHFKVSGRHMWSQSTATLGLVERFRSEGMDVTVDQYPYTASSTTLAILLPSWALAGGSDSLKTRLASPKLKAAIIAEMKEDLERSETADYTYCAVSNCPWEKSYNGLRISEVSQKMMGSDDLDSQIETVLKLVSEGRRVQMVFHKMNEEDVQRIMQAPFTMIASDAGIPQYGINVPHPRAYGTNTRVLGRYVRELGAVTLEDAIRKMTSLPASRFFLEDRGLIRTGLAADLVVFDPATVGDQATYEAPHAYAKGISYVFINGELTVKEGMHTGVRAGQVLMKQ